MSGSALSALLMSAAAGNRSRPMILHVDSDSGIQAMAEDALGQAGFDVIRASNGAEALVEFEQSLPDLVLMSLCLPGMDGLECIRQLRERSESADVPILMIAGIDDVESIARAHDAGASDFVTRPIDFRVLPHRVHYLIRARRVLDALRLSQARLDNAQRMARLGHWEWRPATGELVWSREFARILDIRLTDSVGEWDDFVARAVDADREELAAVTRLAVAERRPVSLEFRIELGDSSIRNVRLEAEPLIVADGQCTHMLGTLQDVTERIDAQAQIHTLAYFDLVTGLPNRAQLYEQLRVVLRSAIRSQAVFALLFLDLDHFKQVNDTLGHDAGDDLLRQVSERLLSVVRDTDTVSRPGGETSADVLEHTVARLGGDEFVVLLGHIERAEEAARAAQRIAASISEPYSIGEAEVVVTTTIGISVFPSDGEDAETLLKHADVAMYHAKERGRNGYQFYSRGIHEKTLERFSLERELRAGIESGQLSLVFQPKVRLSDGSLCGAEALVRWNHPSRGEINPAEFIPLAEDTGLILPIGQWVLREACVQRQRWTEAGFPEFPLAVNCSAVQFTRGDVIADISAAIENSGLDPRWLEVELTESLLLKDIDKGIDSLERMKAIGVQIAIDDFGTGFSSLSYLKRLPVDKLKIDQTFVGRLPIDKGDSAIVSTIVTLSRNLGLQVVAEGVETIEQYETLRKFGCDEAQGYLISWPLPIDEFEAWYEQHRNHTLPKVAGL